MIKKLRDNFKEEMADTFRKRQEFNQPQPPTSPTPPPPVIPPQPPHPPLVAPQSSHVHASPILHRRSRSPLPTRDHLREDKTFRPDKRSISQPRSPHRRCATSTHSRHRHRQASRSPRSTSGRLRSQTRSPSMAFPEPPQRSHYYQDWTSQPQSSSQGDYQYGWSSTQNKTPTNTRIDATVEDTVNLILGINTTNMTNRTNPHPTLTRSVFKRSNPPPSQSQLTPLTNNPSISNNLTTKARRRIHATLQDTAILHSQARPKTNTLTDP